MNIATLTIEMAANVARLRQGMDDATSIVKSATAKMQQYAELAGKALGLIGVGLSAAAFVGFIRNAIDAADALDEMSGRVGVSAKELSGLQLAFRQAGMGNDAMASSIAKLSREMSEGNAGLRALGVNTRNADGSLRTTTAVLLDVADKFTTLEDGAAKTALAVEIFGKSGTEMVPLLNSGSEGIAGMIAMAEKLGLVLEDSTAAQAGQFNDTLELLGLGVQGVGTRIAAQLLPTLNSLTGSFLESMTSGDRLRGVADFLATSLKLLFTVGVGVVEVFNTLGKSIGGGVGAILAVLRGDFAGAKRILTEARTDIESGWKGTAKTISTAWNEQGNAAVTAAATTIKVSKDLLAVEKAREEAAKKSAAAAAKAAEEAKKRAEDGAKLAAGLLAQDSGLSGDFAEKWEKLSAAHAADKIALDTLIAAQKELLDQQPAMKKAYDEAVKASQAAADARRKEADGIDAFIRAQEEAAAAALKSVQDRITSLRDEEQAAELSRSLNISLAEAVERVAIARLQEKQAGFYENSEGWENLRREIEERQKLLGLIARKDVREREERGWTDMWSSVNRTAHDVFVNIFDGGTNVFKKLGQTLKASVLDVLYQMTVRKWMINIGTSVFGAGFGAAAQAATGGAAAAGGASNLLTAASLAGNSSFMMGLSGAWGAGGGLMSTLNAGASLLQTGTLSSITSGLGTIAGALGPIALGIALLSSLIKKSTPHMGAASTYSEAGGLVSNADIYRASGLADTRTYSAEAAAVTGGVAKGIADALNSTARAFGKTAGYEITTAFADDKSKDGAWGSLIIKQLGEAVLDWRDTQTSKWAPREFADGEAGQKEYLAAVAASAKDALVQAIGSVEWATDMLQALGDSPTLESLAGAVTQINAAKMALVQLGNNLVGFSTLSDAAVSKLAKASGGMDAMLANASSYYQSFYTEGERAANTSRDIAAALAEVGLQMPTTIQGFRALVEQQTALGDAGADAVAVLFRVNQQFLAVANAGQATVNAARAERNAAQQAARAAEEAARTAAKAQTDAWNDGLKATFDGLMSGLRQVDDFLRGSILGDNSILSPEQKIAAAAAQFDDVYGRAIRGDTDAAQSLSAAADSLLTISREGLASSPAYAAIFQDVRAKLGQFAGAVSSFEPVVNPFDRSAGGKLQTRGFVDELKYNKDVMLLMQDYASRYAYAGPLSGGGATMFGVGTPDPAGLLTHLFNLREGAAGGPDAPIANWYRDYGDLAQRSGYMQQQYRLNQDGVISTLQDVGVIQSQGSQAIVAELQAMNRRLDAQARTSRMGAIA